MEHRLYEIESVSEIPYLIDGLNPGSCSFFQVIPDTAVGEVLILFERYPGA